MSAWLIAGHSIDKHGQGHGGLYNTPRRSPFSLSLTLLLSRLSPLPLACACLPSE
jgi:hypothetical protein